MYIEEILDKLVGFSSWTFSSQVNFIAPKDLKLLESFDSQINRNLGFTEKQRNICMSILKKYSANISKYLGKDLTNDLATPQFRLPLRVINQTRSVTIGEGAEHIKFIKVKFPYDEKTVNCIKEYKTSYAKSRNALYTSWISWNQDTATWDFLLDELNVAWVVNNLLSNGFTIDETLLEYAKEIKDIEEHVENYVPMVVFDENKFKFVNTHQNIPQPETDDVLEALFLAKKYGIYTWDDAIDLALNDRSIGHFTRKVLRENSGSELPQNGEKLTKNDLFDTIKYSKTILFVIPGGSELSTLTHCYNFLKEEGYTEEQMSVLFRLESSAGFTCNKFIKQNNINNPISDKVKFYFISGKVPKPLFNENIKFDAIINLGNNGAHYTQRNLLKHHHCVINYNATL